MSKRLECNYCGTYTGTIRDASLMKGLQITTVCPTCQAYINPVYEKPINKGPDYKYSVPDFMRELFK